MSKAIGKWGGWDERQVSLTSFFRDLISQMRVPGSKTVSIFIQSYLLDFIFSSFLKQKKKNTYYVPNN